jgi:hypothetical protein
MSTDRDVTRIVRSWLEEGVSALPDRVLDTVLDQLPATQQRRSWWPARRFREMNSPARFAVAAAAVVAVAIVGINLYPRPGGIGGPGPASPSPRVSPSPQPSPSLQAARMTVAGTELPGASLLQLTAQLPAGWVNNISAATDGPLAPSGTAFFVSLVDNTFADPCSHVQRTPKLGPTVTALATALAEIPNVTASQPVQATMAGQTATYVELTIPSSLPCAFDKFYLWQDSKDADWWTLAPDELIRVWILQVQGQRVAIAARSWPQSTEQSKTQLQGVLDSIEFVSGSVQSSANPAAS